MGIYPGSELDNKTVLNREQRKFIADCWRIAESRRADELQRGGSGWDKLREGRKKLYGKGMS